MKGRNKLALFGVAGLILIGGLTACDSNTPNEVGQTTATNYVDTTPSVADTTTGACSNTCGQPSIPTQNPNIIGNKVKVVKKISNPSASSTGKGKAATPRNESVTYITEPKGGQLVLGGTVGGMVFKNGDTTTGGQGLPVDGVKADNGMSVKYHIHAHLTLIAFGSQVAVPAAIGIVHPGPPQNGFYDNGETFYWLHTHDATGIIHVEAPKQETFTLGQFFDIWGESLTKNDVAGYNGPVHVFIDGKSYTGNPKDVPLTAHEQITLEVGNKIVTPPVYTFPKGL